jgi:transposase
VSSLSQRSLVHLGMDVHKDSISIGILRPDDSMDVERIFHDEESVRRFIARMGEPRQLAACYEAGPTGYELERLLKRLQVRCDVVAPSLIPKAPGDRVKTDRRDCRRLARLHRAGELVAIRVPSPEEEAVRDLCRARGDVVIDLDRARRRLGAFLLRHGRVWRGGSNWTNRHEQWLLGLRFDDAALASTYAHHRSIVEERRLRLEALEADLLPYSDKDPYAEGVHRLCCYRGVNTIGALTLVSEVCDWRRNAQSILVHGLRGTGGLRVLERGPHLPGPHHQGRQRAPAHPARGVRLGLPAWTLRRLPDPRGTRASPAGDGGAGMEGAGTPLRAVPPAGCPQERQERGGRRRGPGAGGVPLGGDDRVISATKLCNQPCFLVGRK